MSKRKLLIAPAKVNLSLLITGRREKDNYHLLNSIVAFAQDIYDEIFIEEITAANNKSSIEFLIAGKLNTNNIKAIDLENNTISRALKLLNEYLVEQKKNPIFFDIKVKKHIPISAGLGGGSADCAAVLNYIGSNFNIKRQELFRVAEVVGADIPICLYGRTALISGIGEEIIAFNNNELKLFCVFVNPRLPLSTLAVFNAYDENTANNQNKEEDNKKAVAEIIASIIVNKPKELSKLLLSYNNDLQGAAIKLMPLIEEIIDLLKSYEGCLKAAISGSGPTCFAIFEREEQAKVAATTLTKLRPNWYVKFSLVGN